MYPIDRRILAAHVYSLHPSLRKTARILNVSHMTVSRWLAFCGAKKYNAASRRASSQSAVVADTIRVAIANDPLITSRKLVAIILDACCVRVSRELVRVAIMRLGMTRNKARFFGCPSDLPKKTSDFKETRDRLLAEGKEFWSLDETGFGRHGAPVYGYAPRGEQLRIKKKTPRVTNTLVMTISNANGVIIREERKGAFTTSSFVDFLNNLSIPKDAVILLDNIAFHKSKVAKDVALAKGWVFLFTPPYSPRFNPVEGIFSIVKRAWYSGCSIDDAFAAVTKEHTAAFFRRSLREI